MRMLGSSALTLLFAFAASAAPRITGVTPNVGFSFGSTFVAIHGAELHPVFVDCVRQSPCPISVWFGTSKGEVLSAHYERINVVAPPQQAGRRVDVRITLADGTDLIGREAFRYDAQRSDGPSNYVRYLVPIVSRNVRGANASMWLSELTVHNPTPHLLELQAPWPGWWNVRGVAPLTHPPLAPPVIGPHESALLELDPYPLRHAAFIYVPRPLASAVAMQLRVRDVSREAEGWGTEIPIVTPDAHKETIRLLDVPTDSRYRATLRVYGDDAHARKVSISVYPLSGAEAIETWTVDLEGIVNVQPDEFPLSPAYAQIDPITPAVQASGHERVRVVVSYVMPPLVDPPFVLPIWAFVSITNNTTQQVTTITPQP